MYGLSSVLTAYLTIPRDSIEFTCTVEVKATFPATSLVPDFHDALACSQCSGFPGAKKAGRCQSVPSPAIEVHAKGEKTYLLHMVKQLDM